MSSVAVIGAGAWGRALAVQAARAGNAVALWARTPRKLDLPDTVRLTTALPEAADAFLLTVPMQHLRAIAGRLPPAEAPLIACCKGVEQGTLRLPLEVLAEVRPGRAAAILTGPNFAHEVAAGQPAATVIASGDAALRARLAAMLGTATFRVYGNDDPIGAQVGGAAKNVIAIGAGAVIGAGLGESARAGLITRGLAELARLAVALGGRPETVMGLSGLGDLLLTCTGPSSRNFSLGLALGQGEALADVLAARSAVTEGVATAPALVARAGDLDMPICRVVADLLAGSVSLPEAMTRLLSRPFRDE